MFSEAIIFEDKLYNKGYSQVVGYIVSFVDNDGCGVRDDKRVSTLAEAEKIQAEWNNSQEKQK